MSYREALLEGKIGAERLHERLQTDFKIEEKGGRIDEFDSVAALAHKLAHAVQLITGNGFYQRVNPSEFEPTRIGNEAREALYHPEYITATCDTTPVPN